MESDLLFGMPVRWNRYYGIVRQMGMNEWRALAKEYELKDSHDAIPI
jgi:hypothetical protein